MFTRRSPYQASRAVDSAWAPGPPAPLWCGPSWQRSWSSPASPVAASRASWASSPGAGTLAISMATVGRRLRARSLRRLRLTLFTTLLGVVTISVKRSTTTKRTTIVAAIQITLLTGASCWGLLICMVKQGLSKCKLAVNWTGPGQNCQNLTH